ncbi:MAG: sigma-70 family RNA polymerase sigma factor, partial [Clostridia bacterium]|nr:sigma-70 family RNA polymerase sigma factor [Clostridia bacterium]
EKNVKINAAAESFEKKNGEAAKISDICDLTGLSPEEVVFCQSAGVTVASLEAEDSFGRRGFDTVKSRETEDEKVWKIALKSAVSELPEELKRIIGLRYYHGLSQQKTAEITGLSQVQVSRKEKKAIDLLKVKLKEDFT